MTYKVEFEVDGDAVSYTVRAENVLEAEELAKKKLKNEQGSNAPLWEVKHIENIHDGRERR